MTESTPVPRTLGLIGGLGLGAGIFYYRSLVEAHKASGITARLLMVHADSRRVMACGAAGDKVGLADYLASLLEQLARGGADLAIIPAFTPQLCADELAVRTPIPLIGLLDAIQAEAERRRFSRVALFGARVTIETRMFGKLTGVEVVAPAPEEVDTVASVYARLVDEGRASDSDYKSLRYLAHHLIERERLDGIVLAGTDLAFVFDPENTDFPHIDGARVHINAILHELLPQSV